MVVKRVVTAELDVNVIEAATLEVQVAAAYSHGYGLVEDISITLDDKPLAWRAIEAALGGRVWLIDTRPGHVQISYRAEITGRADPPDQSPAIQLPYQRPSRYCESDRIQGFANRLFRGVSEPADILAGVSSWVGGQLEYVSGSSGPTDGAVDTLLAGRGVCRDYAHLTVALLRAMQIPARLVAVYAPGLEPMDFHAVAEAFIDGGWYVIDPTLLAPRQSLVRIVTGRDAADTSFLANYGGHIAFENLTVTATVDPELPKDDVRQMVQLC